MLVNALLFIQINNIFKALAVGSGGMQLAIPQNGMYEKCN